MRGKVYDAGTSDTMEHASSDHPPDSHNLPSYMIRFAEYLDKSNFKDYVLLLTRPWRMIWVNFLAGLARGVGIGLGFTILAALLVVILEELNVMKLPIIGGFIAELVRIVLAQLHTPEIR